MYIQSATTSGESQSATAILAYSSPKRLLRRHIAENSIDATRMCRMFIQFSQSSSKLYNNKEDSI